MLNFCASYAATQETIKSQATSLATMQGQLANIQQFCMAVSQQPPSTIYQPPSNNYPPAQHQRTTYHRGGRGGGQGRGGHGGSNQQPTWYGFGGAGTQNQRAPTPFKRYKNWNYCFSHGGNVDDAHTSKTCGRPGPTHNRYATRANMMGGSAAGMHKSILPSAAGRTAATTTWRPQQQQATLDRPPVAHMSTRLSTPTGVLHWTSRGHIPSAHSHGLPCPCTWPSNQLCRAVSTWDWNHTDDATAHPTGKPNDDPLRCSQPAASVPSQPAATGILLLTSRGG
jgi:hypothetical protein